MKWSKQLMVSNKPGLRIRNWLALVSYPVLLVNCSTAQIRTETCIVDISSQGYQCYSEDKAGYFLPFDGSNSLVCISDSDLEIFLKGCKSGIIPDPSLCTYSKSIDNFSCSKPSQKSELKDFDNYFCLHEKDFKRVQDRCESNP